MEYSKLYGRTLMCPRDYFRCVPINDLAWVQQKGREFVTASALIMVRLFPSTPDMMVLWLTKRTEA